MKINETFKKINEKRGYVRDEKFNEIRKLVEVISNVNDKDETSKNELEKIIVEKKITIEDVSAKKIEERKNRKPNVEINR